MLQLNSSSATTGMRGNNPGAATAKGAKIGDVVLSIVTHSCTQHQVVFANPIEFFIVLIGRLGTSVEVYDVSRLLVRADVGQDRLDFFRKHDAWSRNQTV